MEPAGCAPGFSLSSLGLTKRCCLPQHGWGLAYCPQLGSDRRMKGLRWRYTRLVRGQLGLGVGQERRGRGGLGQDWIQAGVPLPSPSSAGPGFRARTQEPGALAPSPMVPRPSRSTDHCLHPFLPGVGARWSSIQKPAQLGRPP